MPCLHQLLKKTSQFYHKDIDLGLSRCLALLSKLGDPHLRIPPVFHVAGTNGKGSTLAFIKQILEDNGYYVHRYTSPHLVRFNERIELRGKQAEDDVLADALAEILHVNDGAPITTFEAITCLAFMLFADIPADFTLLEVGVGGRLDATNVIQTPLVTGITSISLDHQDYLGETVEKIAFEKAGIIKTGVPLVIPLGIKKSVYDVISAEALNKKAPLVPTSNLTVPNNLGLLGEHQRDNAAIAVKMIDCASITPLNVSESLHKANWPGRLERLMLPNTELWLDGAHNEAGAKMLVQSLQKIDPSPWTFFIHVKARKNAATILQQFASCAHLFYFIDFPIDGGDVVPLSELLDLSEKLGITAQGLSSIDNLVTVLKITNGPKVITGSLYWVGYIKSYFNNYP